MWPQAVPHVPKPEQPEQPESCSRGILRQFLRDLHGGFATNEVTL